MANVIFKRGTRALFDALAVKDDNTLYWLADTQELYKGEVRYGVGANATTKLAGLMSAEDKAKLDQMISVKISADEGNTLELREDGLYVSVPDFVVPSYTIERQDVATDGFGATYKLKCTSGETVTYVGDEINIPKDLVLQSGSLQIVSAANQPYEGAVVGDPYLDLILNDEGNSHIYVPVKGLVDTYLPGNGIWIEDQKIGVKLNAENANGLVVDENGLGLNLATRKEAGAMSAEDKLVVDSISEAYLRRKYEIAYKPEGTLVDYREKEIRVMCPADTHWVKQAVGTNGNANMYYMGFKAYAPEGAVSFKEDDADVIADQTMYYFEGNDFAGIDEFGRKYSIVWLALATYDEASDTWTYFGSKSSIEKYIGWYYTVEWYDANGLLIESDQIRINLSNEACHNRIEPYYATKFATKEDVAGVAVWESL